MAPTGPSLPSPAPTKRRREEDVDTSDTDSDTGPAPPAPSTDPAPKKVRVIGPSLPPSTHVDEQDSNSESEDDDDFGPSLPSTSNATSSTGPITATSTGPELPDSLTTTSRRDDWMLVPPSAGDWTGRVDPTKIKSRKFNTGKGAKGPPSSDRGASDSWHETPQEKQARLQREMMGIKDPSTKPNASAPPSHDKIDTETAKRLQDYNRSRGPTLYDAHQKSQSVEKDDDPSARAFDREKDIGGGLQINATQRRDLMKKASDFNSRFSGAKYL